MALIFELPDSKEAALKAKALSQGVTVEELVQQIFDRILESEQPETVAAPATERRISQRIAEIVADVPPEEFAKLPSDGAHQVDHYIYGLPKRD